MLYISPHLVSVKVLTLFVFISAVRTCPKLPVPQYGHINCSLSEISYKTVCVVTCNEGYELEGNSKLTCQGNSQWDGKEPKCVGMCFVTLLSLVVHVPLGGGFFSLLNFILLLMFFRLYCKPP